jgi:general secretion pathway protein C
MKDNKTIYTLTLVALLTISAYFLADTFDAMIGRSLEAAPNITSPLERDRAALEPQRELRDYNSVLERGLFGEGRGPSGGPAATSSSSFRLIGTIEGQSFAGAVLEDASGQTFYRINQKLPDGSTIIKVQRDKVTIRMSGGETVVLAVVEDTKIVNVQKPGASHTGIKRVSDGKYMVDQKEVAASTENMSQILTQARALPYMEQGKTVGFRLSEIVPGSIYEKIGLQNGDVIRSVNSQDVDDPAKFFQLYQGLKNEKSITIDVVRGGQRQTLNYDIR